jgi:uncharacterized integral membrane protein
MEDGPAGEGAVIKCQLPTNSDDVLRGNFQIWQLEQIDLIFSLLRSTETSHNFSIRHHCQVSYKQTKSIMLAKLALLALAAPVVASYSLAGAGSIVFTDLETSISPILTLFTDQQAIVTLDGLAWEASSANSSEEILFETFVNGVAADSGVISVGDTVYLPSSLEVGTIMVPEGGRYTVKVVLTLDDVSVETDTEIEAYSAGVAILPLLVILVLAVLTNMVCRNLELVPFSCDSPASLIFYYAIAGRILSLFGYLCRCMHCFWKYQRWFHKHHRELYSQCSCRRGSWLCLPLHLLLVGSCCYVGTKWWHDCLHQGRLQVCHDCAQWTSCGIPRWCRCFLR